MISAGREGGLQKLWAMGKLPAQLYKNFLKYGKTQAQAFRQLLVKSCKQLILHTAVYIMERYC